MKKQYKCTVCGKTDYWGEGWSRYSSIDLDETCPNDVPIACSDECSEVVTEKIKTGEWVLPQLGSRGYYRTVSKERQGY